MRNLSLQQTSIAIAGLTGITILGALGQVSGDVVSVIYASVIGGALGYVNGKKTADSQEVITTAATKVAESVVEQAARVAAEVVAAAELAKKK